MADQIPPELQRIVEFLSLQMDPAEVLAYVLLDLDGQDLRALVPRLVGRPAQRQLARARQTRQWDAASLAEALTQAQGTAAADVFRRLLTWSTERDLRPWYGNGARYGSFFPMLDHQGASYWLFAVWTYGSLQLQFGMMATKPPFDDEAKRRDLLNRLNHIPGVAIPEDRLAMYPSIPLSSLTEPAALEGFLAVFDGVIEEIRRGPDVGEDTGT